MNELKHLSSFFLIKRVLVVMANEPILFSFYSFFTRNGVFNGILFSSFWIRYYL